VLKEEFEERIKPKLDYAIFKDFKERVEGRKGNNKERKFDIAEQFHDLERKFNSLATLEEVNKLLKPKASKDSIRDLQMSIERLTHL